MDFSSDSKNSEDSFYELSKQLLIDYSHLKSPYDSSYIRVDWNTDKIKELLENKNYKVSNLSKEERTDVITMEITYENGKTETKNLSIYIRDDGKIEATMNEQSVAESPSRSLIDKEKESQSETVSKKTIEEQAKDLLIKDSYDLIWAVDKPSLPESVSSYDTEELDMKQVYKKLKASLSTENSKISIEEKDGIIDISGVTSKDVELQKKIATLLANETSMNCVENTGLLRLKDEEELSKSYLFQMNDLPVAPDSISDNNNEVIPCPSYEVSEVDKKTNSSISGLVKITSESKKTPIKSCITMDKLKSICEKEWKDSHAPFVCTANSVQLAYTRSTDGKQLIPVYYVSATLYRKTRGNKKPEIIPMTTSFMIDAITGEVIEFL
ncbi:hypothetical protein P261_02891 [Lachnospiraceae bacterium TWA4]|nr:hypothetical protein P261_02891 [Lachnospiraceae bacterium TWA4]